MSSSSVTSRHNPRFKQALALRDARQRRRTERILVDGAREIGRALAAGQRVQETWVAYERIRSEEAVAVLADVEAAGTDVVAVSPDLLARLAYGDRDDGMVAVFATPATGLARLTLPEVPLVGVLVGVEKPGNLGAVLRSADGAGVDALVVADAVCDVWNPNAIRASLGTIFSLPLAVCTADEALGFLREHALRILAADTGAATAHTAADLREPVAIVMGSEAGGLGGAWQAPDIERIRIPMHGAADSLNVSASAAVLFYEARRQRAEGSPSA